ncbi:MAG: hypothetical protein ACPGQS_07040 [Bradymonadia bacterium]
MQLRVLGILIMLLVGCENGQADADACEHESVFGDGAPAPWFPQWQLMFPNVPFEAFFDAPVLIGLGGHESSCLPDQWLSDESSLSKLSGTKTVFVCYGDVDGCVSQTRRQTIEFVTEYSAPARTPESFAIDRDDARIVSWNHYVTDFERGERVDDEYRQDVTRIGTPGNATTDVIVLGAGGVITIETCSTVTNAPGPDFAVFENGVNDTFLELAFVEVSSDGEHFVRFPNVYTGLAPIGPYEGHDPTTFRGFAGQYRFGFGTPFDLSVLEEHPDVSAGLIDLNDINYVKLIDIIGNGEAVDSFNSPIFDPYPTQGSAGFDLVGLAVLSGALTADCTE